MTAIYTLRLKTLGTNKKNYSIHTIPYNATDRSAVSRKAKITIRMVLESQKETKFNRKLHGMQNSFLVANSADEAHQDAFLTLHYYARWAFQMCWPTPKFFCK